MSFVHAFGAVAPRGRWSHHRAKLKQRFGVMSCESTVFWLLLLGAKKGEKRLDLKDRRILSEAVSIHAINARKIDLNIKVPRDDVTVR